MLKVGDRIRMFDGSYAFGIKNGRYSLLHFPEIKQIFTVVEINLLTARRSEVEREELGHPVTVADILITDSMEGFWFVPSRFAKRIPPKNTITIDGNSVEISDESFEALRKQFLR